MKCCEIELLIPAAITGELDEVRKKALDQHMESCASCRAGFAEASEAWELLYVAPSAGGKAVAPLVLCAPERPVSHFWRRLGLPAAAAVAVLFVSASVFVFVLRNGASVDNSGAVVSDMKGLTNMKKATATASQAVRDGVDSENVASVVVKAPVAAAKPVAVVAKKSLKMKRTRMTAARHIHKEYKKVSEHKSGNPGWTALHAAAWDGRIEDVKMLIAAGADVNAADSFGDTPLHATVIRGRVDAAELLLEHGADADASDKKGWTPLATARIKNDRDMAAALVEGGAYAPPGTEEFIAGDDEYGADTRLTASGAGQMLLR